MNNHVKTFRHKLIPVEEHIQPNQAIKDMIDRSISKSQRLMLETVVGQTRSTLSRWRTLESTMDNLLLQACLEASNNELGFSNGWRFGAPIPPGDVTMNDLWNIIPDNLSIDDLQKYEAIIVPWAYSLRDEHIQLLEEYARSDHKLIIVGDFAVFDEQKNPRTSDAVAACVPHESRSAAKCHRIHSEGQPPVLAR